jgi:hypothetical protein
LRWWRLGDKVRQVGPLQKVGLPVAQVVEDAFLAPGHGEQFTIEGHRPVPVEPRLPEGAVEGRPMAIPLRVRQSAIHIEDQGLKSLHVSSPK